MSEETIFIALEVLEHINKDIELIGRLPGGSTIIFSVPNFKSFNRIRIYDSLQEIWERYSMIQILEYEKIYANQKQDKVYHLILGRIKDK